MDFGRQPQPVSVVLYGAPEDVEYWRRELARMAVFKGDNVELERKDRFVIYPPTDGLRDALRMTA